MNMPDQAKPLTGDAAAAGKHYDLHIGAEAVRLEEFFPVEYAITLRYLDRFIPRNCRVADVGAGAGHYAEFLARRGCTIELVDVSERLLDAARDRLTRAGLDRSIAGIYHASAVALPLPDASFDAVLFLGPLYHLRDPEERQRAVDEAWRVLKPGGIVAAAGINRIAYLRDMFRSPDPFSEAFFIETFARAQEVSRPAADRQSYMAQFLANGALDPEHAPPIGYAHLTTAAEFRELVASRFEELAFTGAESFTAPWQKKWNSKSETDREAWLDIIEATAKTPEGTAYSDHFLFIGRRRS